MSEQLSSDQGAIKSYDTPTTDAAAFFVVVMDADCGACQQCVVDREFARAQERRIAELERRFVTDEVTEACVQTALEAADRMEYGRSATATCLKRLAAEVRRLRGEQP